VRQQRTRPKLLELDENIANLAIESAQDPHALYLNKLSIGFTPISHIFGQRARSAADARLYVFIDELESIQDLSYGQFYRGASRIAAELSSRTRPGDRVILLYPTGPDYLAASEVPVTSWHPYLGLFATVRLRRDFMQLATDERLVREAHRTLIPSVVVSRTPEELANIASLFASSDGWIDRVRLSAEGRWYERLYQGPDYDIWVISWLPGQSTGFHDHGESSGAFVVATGILEEHRPGEQPLVIHPGKSRAFGPDYAHDVRNVSLAPAISIHAYSPPLSEMNEYELDGSRLIPRERVSERAETLDEQGRTGGENP
jgi:mannose-6-phosphate isomerase-like protein (cupin superfamily)